MASSASQPPNGSPAAAAVARRPLVTLLDGRDCSVEMPVLKDVATVAFCDAQSSSEIHDKVLNEAYGALCWDCISLQRDDLLKFKALKVIIKIGSGCDNIDVQAASELGIALSNIPHVGIEETADSTMAHVLTLFRQNAFWANSLKEGKRIFGPEALREHGGNCHSLRGKTLGIVGLGRTGSAVALRAKVFGLQVIFFDPNLPDGIEISLGVEKVESLTELLHRSDCVTLHCSCNPNTRNLINDVTLKSMKQGAFLVNTASAHLIDEMALASMLREGRIAGAALDVHQHERTSLADGPLADCPNLIVTPHCSWYSPTSDKRMREAAAQEMRRMILSKSPTRLRYCVNADLLAFNARRQSMFNGNALPGQSSVMTGSAQLASMPIMPISSLPNHLQSNNVTAFPDGGFLISSATNTNDAAAALRSLRQQPNANNTPAAAPVAGVSNPPVIMSSPMQGTNVLYSLSPNNINMQSSHSESPSTSAVSSNQRSSQNALSTAGIGGALRSLAASTSRSSSHDGKNNDSPRFHDQQPTPVRSGLSSIKQQQLASVFTPASSGSSSSSFDGSLNGMNKRAHDSAWMASPLTPGASALDNNGNAKKGKNVNIRTIGVLPSMSTIYKDKATVSEHGDA